MSQTHHPTLIVHEHHGQSRTLEPVSRGVPLARGLVSDTTRIALFDEHDASVPAQFRKLAIWPDGSIKWLLIETAISSTPHATQSFWLRPLAQKQVATGISVTLQDFEDRVEIDTARAKFSVSKTSFATIDSVKVADIELLGKEGLSLQLTDSRGRRFHPKPDSFSVEECGPLVVRLLTEGSLAGNGHEPTMVFSLRLAFFADLRCLEMQLTIKNPRAAIHPNGLWDLGDPGSYFFKDLSLRVHARTSLDRIAYCTNPGDFTFTSAEQWSLYQDSSGGQNWRSRNHVDRHGELTVTHPGYRVEEAGNTILEGKRSQPICRVQSEQGWIETSVPAFWQNFPKSLRADRTGLQVGLFPKECRFGFELQGGEQKRHVVYLDFGLPNQESIIPSLIEPLQVSVDPDWAAASGAILYLVPHNEDQNQTFLDYVAHIVEGPRSFANRREIIDEYGWRNFGDLYADHEAVNHTGPGPFISHYNNQYDFVQAAFIYALRTADQRWYDLLNECACHTMDIDIYHTDEDKAGFNHGNFWHTDHYREAATSTHRSYSRANKGSGDYGGGPANEHNYSSGLLHYYYLTGDRAAGEAVLELASYVLNADDGRLSLFALIDDGPTGLSSQTADTFFHKPGRGSGNSINTLMDAYRLSNDRRHLRYAETLIQRVIHPADEISALELDEPEVRWSYLAFMQTLGKYLELKCELGEMDYAYFYARDSFLHYVEWMLNHEVPYKEVLHKTLLPTETWPAHDMRKCHIFHVATKFGAPGRCSAYRTSADLFFERSLDDVMSFDTALLARPMIIIAGYGYIHSYFQKNPDAGAEFPCHSYDFGRPQVFVPQRARLKSTFSRKLTHSFREAKRIVVAKLYGVLDRRRK